VDLSSVFHVVDTWQDEEESKAIAPLARRSLENLRLGTIHGCSEIARSSFIEVDEQCLVGYAHASNNLWFLLDVDTQGLVDPVEFKRILTRNIALCRPLLTELEESVSSMTDSEELCCHVEAFRKAMNMKALT
jgi:hypothetical protein